MDYLEFIARVTSPIRDRSWSATTGPLLQCPQGQDAQVWNCKDLLMAAEEHEEYF